jgi:DNA uptake protein ComE-like DNA-binding protein
MFAKTALVAVSLLLSAGLSLAADVKTPAKAGDGAKSAVAKDAAPAKPDVKAAVKAALIDINSASATELKAIPGVGDAFAAKIIAARPYANKAQLVARKVIPVPLYEQIKDRIIAKQPAKSDKPAAKPAAKK